MKWLIDEMLPPAVADELTELGHDACHVMAIGLSTADDESVHAAAVAQDRVIVTENAADFVAMVTARLANDEQCAPVALVRKADQRDGGGLAHHLARHLHQWAVHNPDPYPGPHWP